MTRVCSLFPFLLAYGLVLFASEAGAQTAPLGPPPNTAPAAPTGDESTALPAPSAAPPAGDPTAAPSAAPVAVAAGTSAGAPALPPPTAGAPPPASNYDGPPLLLAPAGGKPKVGAYGGLGVAYSHMLHRDGAVVDLEGAVLVDHRLSLGIAGYVFTRTPSGPRLGLTPRDFHTAYGGFIVRYAFFGNFPVYASVGGLVGGGTLALVEDYDHEYHSSSGDDWHQHSADFRGYFVFQPDISLHVNATRWLRFTITGGYRVATAVNDFKYDSTAMSGAVVGGKIELGWF